MATAETTTGETRAEPLAADVVAPDPVVPPPAAIRTADTDDELPPVAEPLAAASADTEPPDIRVWVGRALTQGGIPVVLTVRAAEPGDEAHFSLSGQELHQDLEDVYTSVVPLDDVNPTRGRPVMARDAEVVLLDKSPVLVAPGVIPVGSPVKFPTGEKVKYGHVQGGPKDKRTFRIEKPRRSSKARAGRIAAAR